MEEALAITLNMATVSSVDREPFMTMAEQHFRELNPGFRPQPDWCEHYFNNILTNPRLSLRWIEVDGERAGFILFGLEDHRFLPRQTGAIYELYVVSKFRRSGIARKCALAAIHELHLRSPCKVQLEIMEGNAAAEGLWASLGFQKVSERWVLKD